MFSFVIFSEEPEFASEIEKQIGASGEARVAAVISDPNQLLGALKSEKPEGLFVDLGLQSDRRPAPRSPETGNKLMPG